MLELQIFLDETKENIPPEDFTVVETEIEFLRHDGAEKLWVSGKVCDYVRAVYQARKLKVTEVASPRSRLRPLVGEIIDKIDSSLLARLLEILKSENPKTLGEMLFHLTHDEFWMQPASLFEHAARFLIINLGDELSSLAEAQRQIWLKGNQETNLKEVYKHSFDEREHFLRKWLSDNETRQNLGEFPLHLSDKYAEILSDEIGRRLRATEGAAVIEFPQKTPNRKIYAKAILDYFSHNTLQLNSDRIAQISPLLSSAERTQLENMLPQATLAPLSPDADFQMVLSWATEKYLPFRASQMENEKCEEADNLAASFADWILENYPKLTHTDRETSPINLRTFYTVKKLLEEKYYVLWVVVDGLNYLNHQKLLKLLGEKSANLRVAQNSAMFAVLPTITEKAKYGLTTGKFPSENVKRDFDPRKNFLANFPNGVYAESKGKNKLLEGLKQETPTVCYWNYLDIDKCFHEHSNLLFLNHDVDHWLRKLADDINKLILLAGENINRIAVVICSDHGQVASPCRKLEIELGERYAHGRTALDATSRAFGFANSDFVKTDNGETVSLNPTSFRLSEPTTIALGPTYFVDLKANTHEGAIGVHGGLFPEEVVVGLAVLMREPSHKKLTATINGNGETGKKGHITLTIDNPNQVAVNPLSIIIENLEIAEQGDLLLAKLSPQQMKNLDIPIEKFPAPTSDDEFLINGVLRYEFDDGTQEECAVTGKLLCKSLYSAKNPSLMNRFKK